MDQAFSILCCSVAATAIAVGCGNTAGNEPAPLKPPDAGQTLDDRDKDGFPAAIDCNDSDPNVNPGAIERCDNEVDDNCNGEIDTDLSCLPPCQQAEQTNSYFGCRFTALDLPQNLVNNPLFENKIFGISIANPSPADLANVTVSTQDGVVATYAIGPLELQTFEDSDRDHNLPGAGIHTRGYHIESDLPVAVYQFNSLDTLNAASTDASMLFAEHNLAKEYFAMDYTSFKANDSFIAVYATKDDTLVEIDPTVAVTGGTKTTLAKGHVMVVSATEAGTSLTGTRIRASEPVGVFGGNRCTQIPFGMPRCDHLEQQIFPRQALGKNYIVGKTHERTECVAEDYVRVLADTDNTTVTVSPAVAGPFTLNRGEWAEFSTTESVAIEATEAVLVGQYLRSSNTTQCADEGDPAFILQVPTAQYRRDYVFLTPPTYDRDFVDIVAPVGSSATLDGEELELSPTPIGDTDYTLTSVMVSDGKHVLSSPHKVGVIVYGYGGPSTTQRVQNVSYGYPAGLDLTPINPID